MTVYRQLGADMRDGLKNIYQQISSASAEAGERRTTTDALFTEASDQLREVVRATEEAAMNILAIIEKQQDKTREAAEIIRGAADRLNEDEKEKLLAINADLEQDLSSALTALSFQDLTGQRVRRVVAALEAIEKSVVELYVSSGLMLERADEDPEKDIEEMRAEAKEAMESFRERGGSELKGPDRDGKSQKAIDDMLAQLGL